MVLHTDSTAGLHVVRQPHPSDNVGLITAILVNLQSLAVQGRQVRLNWIPPATWAYRAMKPSTRLPGEQLGD